MLIYCHVPFCASKCNYCAFHSEAINIDYKNEIIADFTQSSNDSWEAQTFDSPSSHWDLKKQIWLDTIIREIELYARELGKQKVKTIFFGGGTPSLLDPETIEIVIKKIKKHFQVDPKAEISMESNPDSLNSKDKVKDYLRAGINRISIGIQSLDDDFLKILGRAHTSAEAMNAIYFAKSAGCRNVNVDMMWGLPNQKVSHWINQVNELVKLRPDHVSAYGLTLEQDTPLYLAYEKSEIEVPEENDLSSMYIRGSEILEDAGYLQYEISNYSKMGFQCVHNLGYWEGIDYLGLGPSATSTIKNQRWTNPYDLDLWKRAVENPNMREKREILTLQDRVIELIMLRLRTTRGMRVKAFSELTGRDFLKDNKQLIQALHSNGLIRIINGYVRLTRNGFMVSNSILSHLFENTKKYLALGEDKEFLQLREEKKQIKAMKK